MKIANKSYFNCDKCFVWDCPYKYCSKHSINK